jgi:hypothetical protein
MRKIRKMAKIASIVFAIAMLMGAAAVLVIFGTF